MQDRGYIEKKPFFQRRYVRVGIIMLLTMCSLLLAGLLFIWWFSAQSHPQLDGETIEAPLTAEVEVIRDSRGVAKIQADELEDLFYTQGYVMAQDRLFQMDMTRRLAGGRLAEVIGEDALESDKYFRSYGMHRAVDGIIEQFDDETERMVDAFAAGVTGYIDDAFEAGEQPLEFRILGYRPDEWTAEDTAIAVKYMGYTLTGNFRDELTHYELVRRFGAEAEAMFPDYAAVDEFPVIGDGLPEPSESTAVAAYEELTKEQAGIVEPDLEELSAFLPEPWNGSNNWVIGGEWTESGAPLIGDDPHLDLAVPSVWYQTHLELTGDFHSIGVTVPGIPGVVLGHNGEVAWGVTSLSADYEDVFLEQVNPENPNEYLYDGEWEEAERHYEEIHIDDEPEPYVHYVDETRNGPVMNRVIEEGPYQAYSLRWSGLEPGEELDGILRVNRAETAEEFAAGLEGFVTPGLGWVFADTDGNFGWQGQALLPVRQNGDGMFPVPGWDPDFQWDGFLEPDELPGEMNPEQGYVMTANHMPVDEDFDYEIGRSYFPYRGLRLEEMIAEQQASGDPFTLETMREMQTDVVNTQAEMLVPLMTEAVRDWDAELHGGTDLEGEILDELSDLEEEALEQLEQWDYLEDVDSSGALIWHLWYEGLPQTLFERYLQVEVTNHVSRHRVIADAAETEVVFAYLDERYQVPFAQAARETFFEAVQQAEELQGGNASSWRWGDWHQVEIAHPLGAVWPLNHLLNVNGGEMGGSGFTPGASSFDEETGIANHGAGWRFIGDLASTDRFYDVNIPGQSGQWRSPHYEDQMTIWTEGEFEEMIYNKEEAEDMNRVRFVPEGAS
ncbi:penicillin acylase family protein [Alkalicoccus luteus]|uniref:Penicillin acylase family protein n=1 Tax=Alkalicoccus luteus TaxID=1237094 RepID=A0A969PP34_9BACI|nr:penicillin acylase family protein [Alkalicoccus luteus]NJP37781.1 penicillin acylase family protein [Alkalicoccus luteus]